jgi:hypothetical protein
MHTSEARRGNTVRGMARLLVREMDGPGHPSDGAG